MALQYRLLHAFLIISLWSIQLCAQSYLYPVAVDNNQIYALRQDFLDSLSLFSLDLITGQQQAILEPCYRPASISILPDHIGFSFIDNGRIRVKKIYRNKPETLIMQAPLYDISRVQWLAKNTLYCSAKKRMRYGIFQITIHGDVEQLAYSITSDYLYPNIIADSLFYIERSDDENGYIYEIIKSSYNKDIKTVHVSEVIAHNGPTPCAFLNMISEYEGFFIEHPVVACGNVTTFTCKHVVYRDNGWHVYNLFTFDLPNYLIVPQSPERLYESIKPLIPVYHSGFMYFMHESLNGGVNLYRYNVTTHEHEQLTSVGARQVVCSPLIIDTTLWYGGTFDQLMHQELT